MGNSQPESYQYVSYGDPYHNFDNYSQFQLYKISIPSDLVPFYNDWYEERLQRNTPFVRIIDFNVESKGCDACSTSEDLTVYTERLFFLNQLSLSYPEAVFFMKQCLTALDYLYDEFGVFRVTPYMVGVNHKGKVKVWCNENFAENLPEEQTVYIEEEDVVYDLVDMIQEATEDYRFTRTIERYAGSLTFSNTIKILNMMQSQEGLAVNKIFLDLKEYQIEMTKAIQAKNQTLESYAQTTYYETPQVTQTYEIYQYPQQYYVQPPTLVPQPTIQYQFVQPQTIVQPASQTQAMNLVYPTKLSSSDPYAHNPLSILKLFTPPPPPQPQIQQITRPQSQAIHRMKKQQRVTAPEKVRVPQTNIVNRPVIQKIPVTQVDMRNLETDIRKKQNEMKLKQKLQQNYNQIPQVQSVIVVVEQEDRTRKHLDKISVPKNPSNQQHRQSPILKNNYQPQKAPAQTPQRHVSFGRSATNPKEPMSIKQMNYQSEIFNLF